jgi:hypothetical protein
MGDSSWDLALARSPGWAGVGHGGAAGDDPASRSVPEPVTRTTRPSTPPRLGDGRPERPGVPSVTGQAMAAKAGRDLMAVLG